MRARATFAGFGGDPSDAWPMVAPMDFDLTSDQLDVQKLCREFAEGEIAPHAERWDANSEFPLDVVKKMGALGLL
ncbi:MAG: acyl-CoA dehydrogenase family protein, partial [Candidatus Eremiobacterales bacterium]